MGRTARLAIAVAVAGALAAAFALLPLGDWALGLVAWIRDAGAAGVAAFAGVYVLGTVLFLPGSALTIGAGFAYGLAGVLLVSPASVLGATLAFLLGRSVLRRRIEKRLERHPRFAALGEAVGARGFATVFLLRLSPILPFNLLNYALGLTRVSLGSYVLASALGMLPGTFLYVYLGTLVTSVSQIAAGSRPEAGPWGQALFWVGLVATAIAAWLITRAARRALQRRLEGARRGERSAPTTLPGPPLPPADDPHDRTLLANVRPPGWVNPRPPGTYNLVVIGGGTAGLVTAAGGAGLGARVAIIEKHLLGGDCLNTGCVPSKALLHSARERQPFGPAMERLRRLRAEISRHDSAARLQELGVDVYFGTARFVGRREVEVEGQRLRFARAVIATGSRPAALDVPGLAEMGYRTSEDVFLLRELPPRLVVIGGGPLGCELAQAFRRLGSEVAIVTDGGRVLPREEPEVSTLLGAVLSREGVRVVTGARVVRVEPAGGGKRLVVARRDGEEALLADEILVAIGRRPGLESLNLEAAGVARDERGVRVDDRLRTTNPRIFAAGDVCSRFKFTHAADAMARIVLRNALFFGRQKASALVIPWCTYTDPEIARVGLSAEEARAVGKDVSTYRVELAEVDRAVLESETEGFALVHSDVRGRILGATLVSAHAGEAIGELVLAMTAGLRLGTVSGTILPYPTRAEVVKRAADAWLRARLTPGRRKWLERFLRWRRSR